MRFQKTLSLLSVAALLLTQSVSAAPSCVVRAQPAGGAVGPAAVGYAAAAAQSAACAVRMEYSSAADFAAKVAAAGDVVVTGAVDDASLAAAVAASTSAVFVGPQTQSASVRGYDSRVYYSSTDPVSEVVGLMAHVQPSSVAVMQVAGAGMDAAVAAASHAAGRAATVYSGASADAADVDEAQYAAVVAAGADAVVVMGPAGAQASAFVRRIVQEPSVVASGAAIVAPAAMQVSVMAAYADAVRSGAAVVAPSRVVFSTTNPLANDARYAAVASFRADVAATGAAASYNTAELTAAMAGWVAGKVAQQAVARYGASGSGVEAGMRGQNRFVVDDIVVGDYAGPCAPNMRGVACSCNQGGRTIYISTATVAADGSVDVRAVPSADYTFTFSACTAASGATSERAVAEGYPSPAPWVAADTSSDAGPIVMESINCDADRVLLILCIVVSILVMTATAAVWVVSRIFTKECYACYDSIEEHNPVDKIMSVCPSWCG